MLAARFVVDHFPGGIGPSAGAGHSQTPLIINFGKDNPIYKLP
jgi:hypothetical protein